MKLTILGTSATMPTKKRALSSVLLEFRGKSFLFEIPEGTQKQLMTAKAPFMKIDSILVSHLHGDHYFGLPGYLKTASMLGRKKKLEVFGPRGLKKFLECIPNFALEKLGFELKIKPLKKGTILNGEEFYIEAFRINHSIPTYGFVFKEKDSLGKFNKKKALKLGLPEGKLFSMLQKGKTVTYKGKKITPGMVLDKTRKKIGKKISFIFDCYPGKEELKKIKKSDLLVHEATFMHEHNAKAKEKKHSTALLAAKQAKKAKVKKLLLIHFSPRHKDEKELEKEAKQEFKETVAGTDLMELKV